MSQGRLQMWLSKLLTFLSLCFFLTACTFHPLYTTKDECFNLSYPIKIATIQDRNGQILRNFLVDRLTPQGTPEKADHTLEVKLKEQILSVGVSKDATTSRQKAILTADITLLNCKRKIVYKHSVSAINSFTIMKQNYYSDLVAEEYAKKEALRLLAEKIRLMISTYLDSIETK